MLVFVGFLILIIAGINFVNLATARSAERAKEVGIRKVLGSEKKQLIYQFLSESLLLSVISMTLAIAFIQITLGVFNSLLPEPLEFSLTNGIVVIFAILIVLSLGLVAGLYPAFYISSLKPVQVLKGKFKSSSEGNHLREGLMIFQFCISVILITATLVVFRQMRYVQQKDLGFEKENIIVINHNGQGQQDIETLASELRTTPGVMQVGYGNANPGGYYFGIAFQKPGETDVKMVRGTTISDHFGNALGMRLSQGRMFSPSFNDSLSIILNESAVRAIGLTDPVGAMLTNSANPASPPTTYTVVGVVEDFNFESLRKTVDPLALFSTEGQYNFYGVISIRLDSNDISSSIAAIESKWKQVLPDEPFIYSFLDSNLDGQYTSEMATAKILALFTMVAILIACVGLFGLAAYMTNQRTKEIGVRKILGASISNIIKLLSADFVKLVGISLLVGSPVAYYLMNNWLQSFAYRTSLTLSTFVAAGFIILAITAITVSYQAIKAATANPVDSLKEE
ncbi:MAG: FtsX-like permease family protein [Cyclobacteriaceae bacterium]